MQHHPISSPSPAPRPRAFTLTEMLIVMGLIVLIILLALPAFNALTGGRSMEAAGNQISALLGRARAEAIGLQEVAGVMFFVNPRNDRITAALVREVQPQAAGSPSAEVVYLDVIPNRDFIPLPVGIELQMIDNTALSGSTRQDNGYIGYNQPEDGNPVGGFPTTAIGGVILFDGDGRLISRKWCLITYQEPQPVVGQPPPPPPTLTGVANLVYNLTRDPDQFLTNLQTAQIDQFVAPGPALASPPNATNIAQMQRSQFGFVLVDSEPFNNLDHTRTDPLPDRNASDTGPSGNYPATEQAEETWIDENGLPFLVNRYNGTLTRGE